MAQQIATQLWEMRTAQNVSQGKLALKAGVSKATLSQWETGARLPRAVELDAVLTALNATTAERTRIFACLDAPRAQRYLRQQNALPGVGAPPLRGELLRALRLRAGWTQEQTAHALGVNKATIARWERGERQISMEQTQHWCYFLGAREEELVALTTSAWGEPLVDEGATWTQAEPLLRQRFESVIISRSPGLEDLQYVLLRRDVWRWAATQPEAQDLLAQTLLFQAQFASNNARWSETQELTQRAIAVLPNPKLRPALVLRAAILKAATAVYVNRQPVWARGVDLLQAWRERSRLPEFTAWILSDMAKYALRAGDADSGLTWAREAYELAAHEAEPIEVYLRRYDYGKLMVQAGRAEEALRVLPAPAIGFPNNRVDIMLAHADAYRRMSERSHAQAWLSQAYALINIHALAAQRVEADALAALL